MVIVMATSKRTRIGNRYVTRKKGGQFKTNVDVGRSLSADRRSKSKNTVKAGHGHQGDIKRAEGGCGCGANSSMGGKTFAACGCGSKKKAETFNALDMDLDRNDCCELWVEKMYDNGRIGFGEASNLLASIEMDGLKCSLGSSNCSKKNMGAESFNADSKDKKYCIGCGTPSGYPHTLEKLPYQVGLDGKQAYSCRNCFDEVREAESYGAEGTDSYSRSTELGQVNNMQATQSWQNSEPYATLEGYNPVDSVVASPPLGRGVAQDFGSEQGYNDKMDESMGMRHSGKHSQSMKDRRNEASAMDRRHSSKGRKYDDVMTMDAEYESLYGTRQTTDFGVVGRGNDFAQNRAEGFDAEYDSPYGTRQTTDFGMVGQGHDFAQNRAEGFSAEDGSQFMTGARYGAGAVLGITGATVILGMVMRLFVKE